MGWYEDQVVPRVVDAVLSRPPFAQIRARVAAELAGEVLEIGFGSGLNVPHYPAPVTRVRAVDPALVGWKLAAKRVADGSALVELVGLDGQELQLDSASVDHVLCTWTLCTIPDARRALSEVSRVLRPGGELHFVEHGRSPDAGVRAWQDRLTPLQRRLSGGCHLNRPIDELIVRSGLEMGRLTNYYVRGPRAFGYMFEGTATKR